MTFGGTHDDNIRHAITKLAHIHYTTNKFSYRRVLSLGEEKSRVKLVGFTAIDLIKSKDYTKQDEILKKYNFNIEKPIFLFTMHPLSFSLSTTKKEINASLNALSKAINKFNADCIITYPNNDAEGNSKSIKSFNNSNKNVRLYKSLGAKLGNRFIKLT